jgi:hypothetical protein
MRGISDYMDKVAFDCGVAKTVGGSTAIVGGIMTGIGLCLTPVTGGLSLALTVGGMAIGVGSAATTFTSTIVKDFQLKDKVKYAEKMVDRLKLKNLVI